MGKYVNIDGVWKKQNKEYVNIDGVWKQWKKDYVNVDGVWKESSSSLPDFIPFASKEQFESETNEDGPDGDVSYKRGYLYPNKDPWGNTNNLYMKCNCYGTYSRWSVSQSYELHPSTYRIELNQGDVVTIPAVVRTYGSPNTRSYVQLYSIPQIGNTIWGEKVCTTQEIINYTFTFTAPTTTTYRFRAWSYHEGSETIDLHYTKININGKDIPFKW